MIIAIDGPAGAGKSTVSRSLAEKLGYQLVDTGAMYRTVAYEAARRDVELTDGEAVAAIARGLRFEFRFVGGENVAFCNGKALGNEIRTAEVSRNSSIVSAHPQVREALLELQRDVGRHRPSVLEGRDIGTVVFPDADLKIFITASPQVRAHRRVAQMAAQGEVADYDEVLAEIIERDRRDTCREIAPLKQADDAIGIDSTTDDVEAIVERLIAEVEGRR